MMEKSHDQITLKRIFGDYGVTFTPLIAEVATGFPRFSYTFTDIYEDPEIYVLGQLCTLEILYRAHMAATTNLIRTDRWVKGVLEGYTTGNFLTFCASYRGFFESSCDAGYALMIIPRFLSEHSVLIAKSLNKEALINGPGLEDAEDRLIHYLEGKKKPDVNAPKSHRAKPMRDYIDYIGDKNADELHDFYSELCEATHPAAYSIQYLFEPVKDTDGICYSLNSESDMSAINSVCQRYGSIGTILFERSIIPSLMTLKLINLMKIPELITAVVEKANLDGFGRFELFRERINAAFRDK